MGWIGHRNSIMVISALGALTAFGLSDYVGINMSTKLLGFVTPETLIGVAFVYIFAVLYTKYL